MESWFSLSLAALVLFGAQRFLYKVSAERRCNTAWTTFSFMGTVAGLSALLFWILGKGRVEDPATLLLLSLVNSLTFFADTVATMEALKHLDAAIAYPVLRLNLALVAVFSVWYFGDALSGSQIAGICLALAVVALLARTAPATLPPERRRGRGWALVAVAMLAGAASAISCKFAAMKTDPLAFIAVSYAMSMVFSLGLRKALASRDGNPRHREALLIGAGIGVVNFVGFYCLLTALAAGPLSVIISLTGMYFLVAVVLSALVYGERMGRARLAGLALTAVSILLMRAPEGPRPEGP